MAETTEQYRNRINQIKTSVEQEPAIRKMRDDIAEGIGKTGNRQADIENQFQSVIAGTTGKDVISAPEILAARTNSSGKSFPNLKAKNDAFEQETFSNLAQTNLSVYQLRALVELLQQQITNMGDISPEPFDTLADLKARYPNGDSGVFVVAQTGNWYWWNNVDWVSGGKFQEAGLGSKTVDRNILADNYRNDGVILDSSYNLNTYTKDGTTLVTTALNKPIQIPGTAILFVDTVINEDGLRWVMQKIVDFNNPEVEYSRIIDLVSGYIGVWKSTTVLSEKTVSRKILTDSFMSEPVFLTNTINLNTFKREGNFVVTTALNKPDDIGNNTMLFENRVFKSTDETVRWAVQRVTDLITLTTVLSRVIDFNNPPPHNIWTRLNTINRFRNKIVACHGDSLGANNPAPNDYPTRLKTNLDMKPYNVSFGGCQMSKHNQVGYDAFSMYRLADEIAKSSGDSTKWALQEQHVSVNPAFRAILDRLKGLNYSTVDFLTIFYGHNDFGAGVALDNSDDLFDVTTYAGALRYSVRKLQTAFPKLKILIVTPTWRSRIGAGDGKDADYNPNVNGIYLKEYVEKEIEVARELKTPYLDMYHESGINRYNANLYLSDGLHLTNEGSELVGSDLSGSISSHY